ncbi:PHP domain-containing protein [Chlorobium sp. BLA1]|nr:PHP domain-containing protein [Candidatus Chlorobium masyuteum]
MSSGAKFVRADLHIHSFGDEGSYDVFDTTMTPENIVATALSKGLSMIAITDHNETLNVKRAIKYSEGKPIIVIPGIEVSTTQGHLLVYFETLNDLQNFRGKLNISVNKDVCSQGIVDCLNLAALHNGFGILAHIELSSGFEKTIGRFGPPIEEIMKHQTLLGLEISNKTSINFYTDDDDNAERKRLFHLRVKALNLPKDYDIPKLMSSDSHTLSSLGTNADGENKLTRIKVETLTFHSLRIALFSSNSRIRIENFIPERTPKFLGMKLEGGLLDKQLIRFSDNLTCIIGGRGTGKSTLLEALRETSGNNSLSKVVDSDVWPEKITLYYEDEAGQIHTLTREKNSEVINPTDPINGLLRVPIESYGQGETAETIQHSDNNPQVLLNFLDSFIDIKSLISEESEVRELIFQNQSEINKLRLEVSNIPETERQKKVLEAKQEQLKKDKAGELVKYQMALLKEREIRKNIVNDLNELIKRYGTILSDNSVFQNFKKLTDSEIIVGKEYFAKVKQLVAEFSKIVSSKSTELNDSLKIKVEELKTEISNWSEKEKSIQDKIDEKKLDLESKGIPFDLGKINQIAQELLYYQDRLRKLQLSNADLQQLLLSRNELLGRRKDLKNKIYFTRKHFGDTVNLNLKNTVDGFFVSLKYSQGTYSPQFAEHIKYIMDWRTAKVIKSDYIERSFSPIKLAQFIRNRNLDPLKSIIDADSIRVLNDADISSIYVKLSQNNCFEDLESIKFEDRPSITVTKIVKDEFTGNEKIFTKSLSQLSLGQQQSILLAILLQSKSKYPLIIDQPEDNLDSEFIYKTIVANLRKIKENRQVIIVTHNPNIAVLGDAELITPLKSTSIKSIIYDRGSIDKSETRKLCCDILEGGVQAFKKRLDIYGIK